MIATMASGDVENQKREKRTERQVLLGSTDETKPRIRTPREIISQFRKAAHASSVAAHARNKLAERQEKMERINKNAEELENASEDYVSLANELATKMERRKWWQI